MLPTIDEVHESVWSKQKHTKIDNDRISNCFKSDLKQISFVHQCWQKWAKTLLLNALTKCTAVVLVQWSDSITMALWFVNFYKNTSKNTWYDYGLKNMVLCQKKYGTFTLLKYVIYIFYVIYRILFAGYYIEYHDTMVLVKTCAWKCIEKTTSSLVSCVVFLSQEV